MSRNTRASAHDEDFDRDAEEQSEALVVNVSPHTARFEIATVQGSKPRRYKLESGRSVNIQHGYTVDFIGASRQPVRATIESLTEMEVFPKGPRLPMVVHVDKARETRQRWEDAIAKGAAPPAPFKVSLPSAEGGDPVEMTVTPTAPAMPREHQRMAPLEDVEDQDGQLDEPPPDHNDPIEPVTVPAATETKGGGPRKAGR